MVTLVAHRAGNELADLRRAQAGGAMVVEVDVWYFRGRLEVRHARTIGPWWSRRWDAHGYRPYLIPQSVPRLELEEVRAQLEPGVGLMLDLKGLDPRTGSAVRAEIGEDDASRDSGRAEGAPIVVSSRTWRHLRPFRADQVVYSCGSPRQIRQVLEAVRRRPGAAIGVDTALLTPAIGARLRSVASALYGWGISNSQQLREAVERGVTHAIVDDLTLGLPA
jgi:glycerophosphoryl diester phosphodiesterase